MTRADEVVAPTPTVTQASPGGGAGGGGALAGTIRLRGTPLPSYNWP